MGEVETTVRFNPPCPSCGWGMAVIGRGGYDVLAGGQEVVIRCAHCGMRREIVPKNDVTDSWSCE